MPVIANPTTYLAPWCTHTDLPNSADLISKFGVSTTQQDNFCQMASDILFRLTGKRYGIRSDTVRPTTLIPGCGFSDMSAAGWSMLPSALNVYDDPLSRTGASQVILHAPVVVVVTVKVDGVVLVEGTDYLLYDNRVLFRQADANGNSRAWPGNNRLDLDDTHVGTWSIAYQWGRAVTQAGVSAAAVLASELCKVLSGQPSQMPAHVASLTRQGKQVQFKDDDGKTGIWAVDKWVDSLGKVRRRATMMGPDSAVLRRVTP